MIKIAIDFYGDKRKLVSELIGKPIQNEYWKIKDGTKIKSESLTYDISGDDINDNTKPIKNYDLALYLINLRQSDGYSNYYELVIENFIKFIMEAQKRVIAVIVDYREFYKLEKFLLITKFMKFTKCNYLVDTVMIKYKGKYLHVCPNCHTSLDSIKIEVNNYIDHKHRCKKCLYMNDEKNTYNIDKLKDIINKRIYNYKRYIIQLKRKDFIDMKFKF